MRCGTRRRRAAGSAAVCAEGPDRHSFSVRSKVCFFASRRHRAARDGRRDVQTPRSPPTAPRGVPAAVMVQFSSGACRRGPAEHPPRSPSLRSRPRSARPPRIPRPAAAPGDGKICGRARAHPRSPPTLPRAPPRGSAAPPAAPRSPLGQWGRGGGGT